MSTIKTRGFARAQKACNAVKAIVSRDFRFDALLVDTWAS
jgi:ribosomal protein L31E